MTGHQHDVTAAAGSGATICVVPVDQLWEWLSQRYRDIGPESLTARSTAKVVDYALKVKKLSGWLRDFGPKGRFVVKTGNDGRGYVILKGYAGLRKALRGTRYSATNARVIELASTWNSVGKRFVRSMTGVKIALLAGGIALDVCLGLLEGNDLWEVVPASLLKAAISSLAAAGAGALLAGTGIVIAPVVGAFVVGVLVSQFVDDLDRRYHVSAELGAALRRAADAVERRFDDIWKRAELEYGSFVRSLEDWILRHPAYGGAFH
jgi:hypothetical protein